MKIDNFLSELKRRNVYKVAVAYAVVGWLLVQVTTQVFPIFEIPNWVMRLIVLAIIVGFPIALVVAWAFELTPEGLKRTEDADRSLDAPRRSHAWIYVVVAGAVLSTAVFLLGRFTGSHPTAPGGSSIPNKSVAVLPFENLSDDKANGYFAEGIQDEILTRLSKIADLKVISRTSTQKYKSAPDNLREIGQQLGVANLIEGSVQKIANAVHVNVQLIRAATDEHVWAESYNRKLDDVFAVEGEVASAIAEQLSAQTFRHRTKSGYRQTDGECRRLRRLPARPRRRAQQLRLRYLSKSRAQLRQGGGARPQLCPRLGAPLDPAQFSLLQHGRTGNKLGRRGQGGSGSGHVTRARSRRSLRCAGKLSLSGSSRFRSRAVIL